MATSAVPQKTQNAKATTMRAVQAAKAGGPLALVNIPIPEPGPGQVRVRVQACGVCHSDSITVEGHMPVQYPMTPGHEIVGIVDAVGAGVDHWTLGQRVGIGWYGGHCGMCEPCRRGDHVMCRKAGIPGITYNGGYADYVVAPEVAIVAVPEAFSSAEAAPLLCAGITTFNALRNSVAKAGDVVAILGMGGLGHLGVQYAAKLGFETVAIARGQDKASLARELGAHHYIDSESEDVAQALQKLGGARVILATVTSADAMSAAIGGLGYRGEFVVVGVSPEPLKVSPMQLIMQRQSVQGWPCGVAIDSEDTLRFSDMLGVRPRIEGYPLERAAEAYDRMMSGKARFRVVIETGA